MGCSKELAQKALKLNNGNQETAQLQLLTGMITEEDDNDATAAEREQSAGYASDDSSKAQAGDELGEDELGQMQGCFDVLGFDDATDDNTSTTNNGYEMISATEMTLIPEPVPSNGANVASDTRQQGRSDFWKVGHGFSHETNRCCNHRPCGMVLLRSSKRAFQVVCSRRPMPTTWVYSMCYYVG